MAGRFKEGTSRFFVTAFIGFIVVSFMFTGVQTFSGSPDTVAKVGSYRVPVAEYQQEMQRQLATFRRLFGQELTSVQIQRMNIKESALNNLISRKLMLIFADEVGVYPSPSQVKEEIKKLPYFLSNGRFDINRYKAILAQNNLTPTRFEEDIKSSVKTQLAQSVMGSFPISNKYMADLEKFRSQKLGADIVQFNKDVLKKHIPISKSQLKTFLNTDLNKKRVESLFAERKASLGSKEEVKARHILIKGDSKKKIEDLAKKVTPANFAKMANKHSQDPGNSLPGAKGKLAKKGGALGWFSRGKMVPAFDAVAFSQKTGTVSKPVKSKFGYHLIYVEAKKKEVIATYAKHESKLAKELMRSEKTKELDKLVESVSNQVLTAFNSGNIKKVDRLHIKYGLKMESDIQMNRLDGSKGQLLIEADQIKDIFSKGLNNGKAFLFKGLTNITLIKTKKAKAVSKKDEEDKSNLEALKNVLARKMSENVIKSLRETTKITTNTKIIGL
jgi:peptidyl-prolyl cis-trans isomerase D